MFEHPFYLLLLWFVPFLGLLFYFSYQRKVQAASKFLSTEMMARLMPPLERGRFFLLALLPLSALFLALIAAAGPLFGVYYEPVSRKGADVCILLDVSRSMLAEDVSPNRLVRAKSDIKDICEHVVGDRIGLIAFAGKPIVRAPLTTDLGFFNDVLDKTDTNSAPRGGTAIGDAIRKGLDILPKTGDRDQVLVLITDGDDQESMPLEAAQEAAARGVKILAIGLGDSDEGGRIPIRDEKGSVNFLKYDGREVWSKVDDQILRKIAEITGGRYIPAGTKTYDLGAIYAESMAPLKAGEYQVEERKKFRQQFQFFLGFSVLLLLIFILVPENAPRRSKTDDEN
ncbi:MAG: vWA domain-containing protein [Thermoguttaceae bacterium]